MNKHNDSKNKKKWIYLLIFYIMLGISIFLVYNISVNLYSRYTGGRMYEELKDKKPVPPPISQQIPPSDSNGDEADDIKKDSVQMLKDLKEKNSDTVAWIDIPGTVIDYPVMQASDNKYYLRKTFSREYNILGSIFADYKNSPNFDDQNTVLYGHNMKDGSMFYDIILLKNQDFYDLHNKIIVSLDNRILEYTIFSVYEVNKDYDYRSPNYSSEAFKKLLTEFKTKSVISSDITPAPQDRILTLSTCSYSFNNARLVAHAVLTSITEF